MKTSWKDIIMIYITVIFFYEYIKEKLVKDEMKKQI